MSRTTSKPIAVLISDIHFTVATIEHAYKSLRMAQYKAKVLDVPLVVCGDTLDSKAIMRAECVNKLIEIMKVEDGPDTIFLVGNHDLCNERGEAHSLNFLKPYAVVVDSIRQGSLKGHRVTLIPYQSDVDKLREVLKDEEYLPKGSLIIMHQGLQGSNSGEYIHDKTALNKEDVADFRVISGHYHARQDIKTGRPQKGAVGLFSYIGNPYSLTFGEADDPEKGFQILYDDGLMELVPTNIRRHRICSGLCSAEGWGLAESATPTDLVWVKMEGTREGLANINKDFLKKFCKWLPPDFKLDLIPTDVIRSEDIKKETKQPDVLDDLIESMNISAAQVIRLKSLWKELV